MSTKAYCGRGAPPKGRHRGTGAECLEMGQVRYWGEKEVNPRLLALEPKQDLEALQRRANIMVQRVRKIQQLQPSNIRAMNRTNGTDASRAAARREYEKLEREEKRIRSQASGMQAKIDAAKAHNAKHDALIAKIEREDRQKQKEERKRQKEKEKRKAERRAEREREEKEKRKAEREREKKKAERKKRKA